MAAPFSNTHLRVPRGFGTVLEGLAREVLRDQPEDIPTYAMKYFNDLLKQRDESGMDPAEWAARLEDRYYNNHAFKKNTETSHEKESEPEAIISEGKSQESETENESSHSAEVSALSITQPDVSEKDDSTEGSDEEEKVNIIERFATEEQHSKGHSVAARQSDEESNTDEEKDPPETTFDQDDRPNFEMDDDPTSDENISQFHSELTDLLSFKDIPNVDMFSHESEDDADDHQGGALEEDKIVDSEEENTEVTEAVEAVLYSGPADVDICAAELGRTEEPLEKYSAQDNTYVDEDDEEEESLNLQLDTELSHYEISQGSQQEAEDEAQNINEGEILETGASREESNKSSALNENNLDDNPILKEDSLVEVSFEDVPEAQHITEDEEETLMEDASVEILRNTELKMEQTEESIELTTSLTDLNISDMDEQIKPEMDEVMKDDISEEEEIESHHASFDMMKEKVDTNNSNLHDGGNGERTSTVADLEETDEEMEKQEIASLTHSADWTAADNEEEDGPHEYEKDATASANKSDKEECSRPQEEEDIMDIPLDDPEANRAAAKIQAGFRGHMTRKKMKPEDKTEGEEVSSTGDVLSSSQGVSETGRSGAVERDDTSVPEQ